MHGVKQKGFTLIEVVLSLSLITLIVAFSIPVYHAFQIDSELDLAATTIIHTVRRAQTLAQAGENDSSWGVHISSQTITLFRGTVFTTRDQEYDEISNLASSITSSGMTEIVYAKMTGLPSATGTFSLTASTGETKNITVNSLGIISY